MKPFPHPALKLKQNNGSLGIQLAMMAIVISIVAVIGLGFLLLNGSRDGETKEVIIPRGSSLTGVAALLKSEKVIDNSLFFRMALRVSGGASKVRAGEFRFRQNMRPIDAIFTLYYDSPVVYPVTIPEGWNVRQIGAVLAQNKLVNEKRFLDLTLNRQAAQRFNLPGPSLEGYLFPETYNFSKIDGEERIIERMVQTFKSHYEKDIKPLAEQKKMSLLEVVTLASIVEKETGVATEREMVSSVFHNRLKKKMRLQSDPTTIYGIENFDGNLTRAHLRAYTPYNTYVIPALPPGAIASPGLHALRAAVNPAETNYLYFVANKKGSHLFSETYAQHTRNVNAFQK